MYKTHVYIELSSMTLRAAPRKYAYLIELEGEKLTRTGRGSDTGTAHHATMKAASEALGRFQTNCQITVHAEDIYFLNALEHRLPEWESRNFKNADGEDMKNADLWREIRKKTKYQVICTEPGTSKYTKYLQDQMKGDKDAQTD